MKYKNISICIYTFICLREKSRRVIYHNSCCDCWQFILHALLWTRRFRYWKRAVYSFIVKHWELLRWKNHYTWKFISPFVLQSKPKILHSNGTIMTRRYQSWIVNPRNVKNLTGVPFHSLNQRPSVAEPEHCECDGSKKQIAAGNSPAPQCDNIFRVRRC